MSYFLSVLKLSKWNQHESYSVCLSEKKKTDEKYQFCI